MRALLTVRITLCSFDTIRLFDACLLYIDFQTKHFSTNPYYAFGYEYYLKSVHGFIKDDYKKVTELSTLADLDNILVPMNEEAEEVAGEIAVARCRDYFDKNDQDKKK